MVQSKQRTCCRGRCRAQEIALILYVVFGLVFTLLLTWNTKPSWALFTAITEKSDTKEKEIVIQIGNASCDQANLKEEPSKRPEDCRNETKVEAEDPRVEVLLDLWNKYYLSWDKSYSEADLSSVPYPPHLENCTKRDSYYNRLDNRAPNGDRPAWTIWKGLLGLELGENVTADDNEEGMLTKDKSLVHGPYPPWVLGADEDNIPFTRRVQRDLWVHQHPKNCSDPSLKFLFINFSTDPGYGIGAQLHVLSGMFAVAINEKRILVLDYFNRADHEGCTGSRNARWTCYFASETSEECRARALDLRTQEEARKNGTIHDMSNYWSAIFWTVKMPELWGKPWEYIQPTDQVNGKVFVTHGQIDVRWWRSQVIRYLTRYPSEYLCSLLNDERHRSFGRSAAQIVLQNLPIEWPKVPFARRNQTTMDKLVWSHHMHRPWVPRPLISVHVRQGDKHHEMRIFGFKSYMQLAEDLRERFPNVQNIWLSTEMQNVIDEIKDYPNWKFFYTNITRQIGGTKMRDYESSLGYLKSSNNAFVNLMMAVDCDFFIDALGSTWGYVIDYLRGTSGKVMAGMLSVNPGQFWIPK